MTDKQETHNGNSNIEKIIELLWDEFKFRQQHYWKSLSQYSLAIITLWAIPYINSGIVKSIDTYVFFFPTVSCLLTLLTTWHLGAEYQRLQAKKKKYDELLEEKYGITFTYTNDLMGRIFGWRIGKMITYIFLCCFLSISILDFFVLNHLMEHLKTVNN